MIEEMSTQYTMALSAAGGSASDPTTPSTRATAVAAARHAAPAT